MNRYKNVDRLNSFNYQKIYLIIKELLIFNSRRLNYYKHWKYIAIAKTYVALKVDSGCMGSEFGEEQSSVSTQCYNSEWSP